MFSSESELSLKGIDSKTTSCNLFLRANYFVFQKKNLISGEHSM